MIYLCVGGVSNIIGKLLTRAITLLQTSSHLKVMGFQSHESPHFGNFMTPNLGLLGQNDIWV
jgi:hypothetical protein